MCIKCLMMMMMMDDDDDDVCLFVEKNQLIQSSDCMNPDSNHLLSQRLQMTFARCHFAHRTNLIANRWFDVGPTPLAQKALHMPT